MLPRRHTPPPLPDPHPRVVCTTLLNEDSFHPHNIASKLKHKDNAIMEWASTQLNKFSESAESAVFDSAVFDTFEEAADTIFDALANPKLSEADRAEGRDDDLVTLPYLHDAADEQCQALQGPASTSVSSKEPFPGRRSGAGGSASTISVVQATTEGRCLKKEAEREANDKEAEERYLAKEAATEEKRLAAEAAAAAAEEKRLAKKAAAEEKRLAKAAAAEEKRLAKEAAADEKRKAAEEKERIAREAKEAAKQKKKRKNAAGTKKNATDCSIMGRTFHIGTKKNATDRSILGRTCTSPSGTKKNATDCSILSRTFPSVFDDEGYIKCLLP